MNEGMTERVNEMVTLQTQEVKTYQNHVKEVGQVIDALTAKGYEQKQAEVIALTIYETITEDITHYMDVFQSPAEEIEEAFEEITLKEVRELVDRRAELVNLDWRTVKFKTERVKVCRVCQLPFYDVSRNGAKVACDDGGIYRTYTVKGEVSYRYKDGKPLSVCEAIYQQEQATEETSRGINENLVDFNHVESTEEGDAQFMALMAVEASRREAEIDSFADTFAEQRAEEFKDYRLFS
ncbi:CGNR zinc finger domain-containing protein [Alkalibacillus sp. S2W]|uniref:CGNR zinc finger domain-containing protein n=1 Tax=Alkalibacillus sp. S2W TaxID=3386553 RepID=UPI00398D4BCA